MSTTPARWKAQSQANTTDGGTAQSDGQVAGTALGERRHQGGRLMSDSDNALVQATDDLIALYKSVERRTLDLPLFSLMPFLIFMWASLKFSFFLWVGILLIIPVNFVILIRNMFPGHWRYRPFFLAHVYYVWLWLWRGEAPTGPFLLVRPLLNVFMKAHFERRLRRLRLEALFNDSLPDATRSALLGRLDAALERWKAPRFSALFFTAILPTIVAVPAYYKQLIEFLGSLGIHMPTDVVFRFIAEKVSTDFWSMVIALSVPGYLLAIPVTALLAKRGLFLGAAPNRICFPGGQGGTGIYAKEREILSGVGVHIRETPFDIWFSGIAIALGYLLVLLTWDRYVSWMQSISPDAEAEISETQLVIQLIVQTSLFIGAFAIAALRRGRTGRL
jgi:hypothetical protein